MPQIPAPSSRSGFNSVQIQTKSRNARRLLVKAQPRQGGVAAGVCRARANGHLHSADRLYQASTCLLLGIRILGLLALPFVPQQSYERIASVFNAGKAGKSAYDSADAGRQLLIDSLKATARNPIFGVGAGCYRRLSS